LSGTQKNVKALQAGAGYTRAGIPCPMAI